MKVRGLLGRSAAVVAATALATAGMILAVGASAGAESVEKSYEEEGDHQYVVPAGVCWVKVEAFGAQGGDAIGPADDPLGGFTAPGGLGGAAEARIPVTPGETLWVFVGGEGEDTEPVPGTDENVLAGEGGFNGGGDGGAAGGDSGDGGAGGGGASDVRQGGKDLDHRVLVAGGGGGAAVRGDVEDVGSGGGDGGGEEGEDGEPSQPDGITPPPIPEQAGEGGNEDEGGDGGISNLATLHGEDGEFGEGGDGGSDAADDDTDGGGGGGGGWYGGGGGGGADEDAPIPPPHVHDGAGGGGSGFGPEWVEFDAGVQEDDGEVRISYDPVVDACVEAIVVEPKFTG